MKEIPGNTVCVRPGNNGKDDQAPPYYVDHSGCVTFI